jgi:uncharacterized protein (UPF0276 family)
MLPFIGHGIGLRRRHFPHLLEHAPDGVDWFEVISEDYFAPLSEDGTPRSQVGGRPWHVLEHVRAQRPIVLHGVALGIGNPDPMAPSYLQQLARVIERIEPAWVSDHLCWGALGDAYAHELLPMPYDEASFTRVAARVELVQDVLRRPLVLENISAYAQIGTDSWSEPQFLNRLVAQTGCRLLLDVNNVYVCAQNLGFSAEQYLDAIDARAVVQVHLAGHSDYGDHLMDTHVGPVPEVVWALYRRLIARTGPVSTLVEWDSDVPEYAVVAAEAERARTIAAEVQPC